MSNLPVREMVLYKHGVGFFVRQGAVEGEQVQLTFRSDEINDVLKSLAVFDQSGGQVLGLHYQTPKDQDARLASSSVRLSESGSLRDLIRDLRGRECELQIETTPGTTETVKGRIIGLNDPSKTKNYRLGEETTVSQATISVLTSEQIRVFPFDSLRTLRIEDVQSAHDLTYFLDTSMAEDDRRVVTVRLSAGEHDLAVYYVAPSPTWRVSYRLVAESEEGSSSGTALLQGWGLFDNRLEEDLDDVRVTLVAGQPISFIYDLYASRIPQRPTVEDESRIAPGPIEYASGMAELADADPGMDRSDAMYAMAPQSRGLLGRTAQSGQQRERRMAAGARAQKAPQFRREQASSAQVDTQSKEAGETFQYIVTAPVTVKRGESALVPILSHDVAYQRELLYNRAKLPDHPVVALRFTNNTGLTLERGPVTVVENGDYKGEAVVPFTKEDNEVYLPYAVELGIKVLESQKNDHVTAGLNIKDEFLIRQVYRTMRTIYTLENATKDDHTVTIEAPINHAFELYDTREPDVETAEERRWRVNVPRKSRVQFIRSEREMLQQKSEIRRLDYQTLERYLRERFLDDATYNRLRAILDVIAAAQAARTHINEIVKEREGIYSEQEQLRANLGSLQPTGQEAALRNRLLQKLEATQDRLDAIEQELAQDRALIERSEEQVMEMIAELS